MPSKANALPKSYLLRKPWEYQQVYRDGKRLRNSALHLIIRKSELDRNRIGISIHHGIKGAARRNRIKRIIRECFRHDKKFVAPGRDIVFAIRPGFELKHRAELANAVAGLLAADLTCHPGRGQPIPDPQP